MWRCTRDAISSPPWPRLCCVGQGVRGRRERERGQSKARWEERLQVPHIPAVPLVRGGAAAGTREQCLRFVTASWCGSLVRATSPRTRIRMIDFGVVRSPFSSICERGRRHFFARGVRAAVGRVRRARVASRARVPRVRGRSTRLGHVALSGLSRIRIWTYPIGTAWGRNTAVYTKRPYTNLIFAPPAALGHPHPPPARVCV